MLILLRSASWAVMMFCWLVTVLSRLSSLELSDCGERKYLLD